MPDSKLLLWMLAIALAVAYFSNRGKIPIVNPGAKVGAG
jgi:hypothetical protein